MVSTPDSTTKGNGCPIKEDVLRQEAERLNNELNDIRRNDDPTDYRLKLLRTLDFFKSNSDFYMTVYNAGLTQILNGFGVA